MPARGRLLFKHNTSLHLNFQAREILAKRLTKERIPEIQFDVSFEIAQGITGVIVPTLEAQPVHRIVFAKHLKSVSKLNLAACVGVGSANGIPYGRFQNVAAEDSEPGWRVNRQGFLD
jgi:hypothetical protein